jgi:hypothetical protein
MDIPEGYFENYFHKNLWVWKLCLTLLVPPDFGGASEKCQGEF